MPEPQDVTLGPDDYTQLRGMLLSSDPQARAQGVQLTQKMTPEEHQGFSSWAELHRVDNSVLGMPPEIAAMGVGGIARAAAGEGLSLAGRAVAGVKAAVAEAAPAMKYQASVSILQSLGVPAPIAMPIAMMVSGYKRGAKEEPPIPGEDIRVGTPAPKGMPSGPLRDRYPNGLPIGGAPPTTAVASPETAPVPPAPQSPPATPVAAPSTPPPSTSPAPAAPVTVAAKVKLPADVAREVDRMVQRGMSDAQIQRVVLNTLKLRQSLQTPTDVDVAAAIRARNETGRWPD